ncbi:MAG: secretin N-terminal domain-containing protein, partial [Sulfurimonas sp.]
MRFIKAIFLTAVLVLSLSAREQVNVNFANLEIDDFIKLVSKITNKNILINHKVNGTVDFVSTAPIYDDELMGILISVLESKGFTLIEDGSLYEIVRSTDAAQSNAKVVSPESSTSGNLMVTQAIVVKGENVDIVAAKIRYLISKTAKLMTMKESNTMLITDYPKNIETVKQVINDIDTNNAMIVKIIPVKNTEGKKLQAKLADIAKSIFNEKVDAEIVKIIHDENANTIIVVGNAKNVKKIEALVAKLDVESNIASTLQIFTLKNSDAKAVAATINEIVSKQTYADPAMKPNISASEEINAVIVVGDPQVIKGIKVMLDELDKEKYQVYVQARIINIYKKDAVDLGVKYGFDGAAVSSNGGLYSLAANFGGTSITPAAATLINIPDNLTHGFALGATIDFLEKNDASKSISNPSILCVNNKESSIYVGQTI